jgi:hypothetical protein
VTRDRWMIEASRQRERLQLFPLEWLEPETVLGTTPWLSGRNQIRAWCLCGSPGPTFGSHFDQLSAKKTPALTGVTGRGGARDNGFFLGFNIGNVWENFSEATLAKAFGLGLAELLKGV